MSSYVRSCFQRQYGEVLAVQHPEPGCPGSNPGSSVTHGKSMATLLNFSKSQVSHK